MDKMKKVPEIRFKEFEEEWVQSKLGDCFLERVERSAIGELISVTINNGVVKAADTGRADSSSADKSNYKRVEVGDIAYNSMRMWQGACGYSSYSGILSPAYTVVTPTNGVDVKFYYYLFKRTESLYQFRINSQGLTSDTWNLKYPSFSKINCMVPKEPEQKRIAKLFLHIDNLISKLEQKLEKLRNIKQSLLNQMFVSVNRGGDAPLIRFKGYDDEWKTNELSEVAKRYFVSNQSVHHQNLLSLSYGKIKRKNIKSKKGLLPNSFDTYQIVKNGIIVMRFTDLQNDHKSLRIGLAKEEGIVSPAYTCISVGEENSSAFLYEQLNYYDSVLKQFYKMGDGLRQTLSYKDIERLNVYIPHIEEQENIVFFNTVIETIIGKVSTKLTKLNSVKQSLLQKMFV